MNKKAPPAPPAPPSLPKNIVRMRNGNNTRPVPPTPPRMVPVVNENNSTLSTNNNSRLFCPPAVPPRRKPSRGSISEDTVTVKAKPTPPRFPPLTKTKKEELLKQIHHDALRGNLE